MNRPRQGHPQIVFPARAAGWIISAALLALISCTTAQQAPEAGAAAPIAADATTALKQRAKAYWKAHLEEDWVTAYSFEDPAITAGSTVEVYVAWSADNQPFRVHEYTLGDVVIEDDMGWVEVTAEVSVRKFPGVPPRPSQRIEPWCRIQDQWYPVPKQQLDAYPRSPWERNRTAEDRLHERFEATWQARENGDWAQLRMMSDPRDHDLVSVESFSEILEKTRFLAQDVVWVEVVEEQVSATPMGTVRVAYQHTLNDPSLTKLPPQTVVMNERWVQVDGQWYLDLVANDQ